MGSNDGLFTGTLGALLAVFVLVYLVLTVLAPVFLYQCARYLRQIDRRLAELQRAEGHSPPTEPQADSQAVEPARRVRDAWNS